MVVSILKRIFRTQNDSVPIPLFGMESIRYKEVLRINSEDVSFDLNSKVPKLYIKGKEVGVVSMTNHYVTSHDWGRGTNVITFIYLANGSPEQKVLSVNKITGEVMSQ